MHAHDLAPRGRAARARSLTSAGRRTARRRSRPLRARRASTSTGRRSSSQPVGLANHSAACQSSSPAARRCVRTAAITGRGWPSALNWKAGKTTRAAPLDPEDATGRAPRGRERRAVRRGRAGPLGDLRGRPRAMFADESEPRLGAALGVPDPGREGTSAGSSASTTRSSCVARRSARTLCAAVSSGRAWPPMRAPAGSARRRPRSRSRQHDAPQCRPARVRPARVPARAVLIALNSESVIIRSKVRARTNVPRQSLSFSISLGADHAHYYTYALH